MIIEVCVSVLERRAGWDERGLSSQKPQLSTDFKQDFVTKARRGGFGFRRSQKRVPIEQECGSNICTGPPAEPRAADCYMQMSPQLRWTSTCPNVSLSFEAIHLNVPG